MEAAWIRVGSPFHMRNRSVPSPHEAALAPVVGGYLSRSMDLGLAPQIHGTQVHVSACPSSGEGVGGLAAWVRWR
eukprot:9398918-Pyramimonas_sp.AAC.1